ncbi:MAG: hypothetical protein JW763_02680 [candidate division Zixibacteria bacterium]|nr:hypothetical protein [candidate division Zixibacteria bacterium]
MKIFARCLRMVFVAVWCTLCLMVSSFSQELSAPSDSGRIDTTSRIPADSGNLSTQEAIPTDSSELPNDYWDRVAGEYQPTDTISKTRRPPLVAYDFGQALHTAFLTQHYDVLADVRRSFFHDAGDFLKFNPSNLVIYYQNTPMRTVVVPYGLPGDRVDVILDQRALHPIAHEIEPDNRRDFNDIPTAVTNEAYNIEGPLGLAFGGNGTVSSLVMFPLTPDTTQAVSGMAVDKGSFGYAYTRGRFAHRNERGRQMRFAAGYRKANGAFRNLDDDAYHQWGDFRQPLTERLWLNLSGRLYRRDGAYLPQADVSLFDLDRFRRDRDLSAALALHHDVTSKTTVSFRHERSETKLEQSSEPYYRNLDIFTNGLILTHERQAGNFGVRLRVSGVQEKFEDKNLVENKRHRGMVDAAVLSGDTASALTMYARAEKVGGYDPAPTAMAAYIKRGPSWCFSASVGYCTRFPRQYELDLVERIAPIYDNDEYDYYEIGNPQLKPEKQIGGNVTFGLGKPGSDVTVSLTGGKIFDGIDWRRFDTLGLETGGFRPVNHDLEYANATIRKRLHLGSFVTWSGGGSYRYLEIADDDDPPYAPEYQGFTGLELYYYVSKLELHLYAYGELLYSGPYTGCNGDKLGEDPILNLKLSFRIKQFRFFYIFQDLPSIEYRLREDQTILGRYNYYGITWDFLD